MLFLASLTACNSAAHEADLRTSPRTWAPVVGAPTSPQGGRHDDLFFVSPQLGWVVNTRGNIYRTADGGREWSLVASDPALRFRAVGFATPEVGWTGNLNRFPQPAPDSALWETRDGGVTWINISDRIHGPDPGGICGIHVLDQRHIFAVGRWPGSAVFLRSADGGASWTSINLDPMATTLVDVYFLDERRGIVVGGAGRQTTGGAYPLETPYPQHSVVLRTSDGGDTWTTVFAGQRHRMWAWKISFVDESVGYVSVEGFAPGTVLKTVDGGETWQEIEAGSPSGFQGIGFLTADTGWVASHDRVYHTSNGGGTWSVDTFGTEINRFRRLATGEMYASGATVYRFGR